MSSMQNSQDKEKFIIKGLDGEKELFGKVKISGAKNAILSVMASSALFEDGFSATNVPEIEDVKSMGELLNASEIAVEQVKKGSYKFTCKEKFNTKLDRHLSKKMRASILLTGPILARYGKVEFPHPGGCVIGNRPIDLFEKGFMKMGASVKTNDEGYTIRACPHTKDFGVGPCLRGQANKEKLTGAEIFFNVQSHTATETFIMAGVLAKGKTILKNCAMEPEVKSLADFLNLCGAKIKGAGTPTIEIVGTNLLKGKSKIYKTMPDRIETGSFLVLGALCAKELEILNCNPTDLEIVINMLKESGVDIETSADKIIVRNKKGSKNSDFKCVKIKTHEYPGFPTDLQAPMMVFLTQASGESVVFETIFEGRLNYTEDLIRMGADITVWNQHQALVKGPTPLKRKELDGPDIRAGLAYIIAALVAKGESIINNVYYIDRGYENIEGKLSGIGVDIKRAEA